jgi:hypothetical protein
VGRRCRGGGRVERFEIDVASKAHASQHLKVAPDQVDLWAEHLTRYERERVHLSGPHRRSASALLGVSQRGRARCGTLCAGSVAAENALAQNRPCRIKAEVTEKGEVVNGRGDPANMHDILTGSDPAGNFSTAGGDTTCGNGTKSGEGAAIVGHHELTGSKDTRHMKSWNSSHGSRGCTQENLKASGGAGLLYCFVAN